MTRKQQCIDSIKELLGEGYDWFIHVSSEPDILWVSKNKIKPRDNSNFYGYQGEEFLEMPFGMWESKQKTLHNV